MFALGLGVRGLEFVLHEGGGPVVQPAFAVEFGIGLIDDRDQRVGIDAGSIPGCRAQLPGKKFMHQRSHRRR
jgi:hypothetical protein